MSITKLRLWFSSNTPRHLKEQVVGIFGIPTMDCIGTYLGTPIFTTCRTTQSYQYLVDKIRLRIEGWQAKYLSMADRATFIKASVTSIPSTPWKPHSFSQRLFTRLTKWVATSFGGILNTIEVVTRLTGTLSLLPKEAGGLRIPSTRHRNRAILMNQAWCLYTNPNMLWA